VRDHLRQLAWAHALTAGIMALALFVVGAFMLIEINLEKLLRGWGAQIQIIAYLKENTTEESAAALLQRVQTLPEVERARYVSREQAWRDFHTALGSQAGLLEGLPREVLPASIEISLREGFRDSADVESLAGRLRQHEELASVEYPSVWIERLGLAILWLQWAKWFFAAALFLAAFFVVGSTIRLAAVARKPEVEIMQLVGASEELIQAPFVIEGMLQGLAGAALALAGLAGAFALIESELAFASGWLAPLAAPRFLDGERMLMLVAAGVFLGVAGSVTALRRFVRTWRASAA
jgi:cell division transport system permease protein